MDNVDVKKIVGDAPHMSLAQANAMTKFMAEQRVRDVLELGFAHGVSTCYMAAALARSGGGSVVTIDLESARQRRPNIEELLARTGLNEQVKFYYEPTSYNWRLMKFLEVGRGPQFDLCYLDGAHNWFVDGLAFYLIDQLLRPGGWIILDDLDWTYERSPTLAETKMVLEMPEDERTTPQVRKIYELLIKRHPQYHNFRVEEGWAFAQKKASGNTGQREVAVETVVHKEHFGLGWFLMRCARRVCGKY